MKDKYTQAQWNNAIEPIIKRCAKQRGAITAICVALSKRAKKQFHLGNIKSLLHKNPAKRTHPLYGLGKVLIEVGTEVVGRMELEQRDRVAGAVKDEYERTKGDKIARVIRGMANVMTAENRKDAQELGRSIINGDNRIDEAEAYYKTPQK